MPDPSTIDYWNQVEDPKAAAWSDPDWEQGITDCLAQIIPWVYDTVLDVGAGVGRLAIPLAEKGLRVTAFEPSATMREAAPPSNVSWCDVWPDSKFDTIFIVAVLQHLTLQQQQQTIATAAARLAVRGVLIFQTVLGDADGPGSHHTNFRQVGEWCNRAGLKIIKSQLGKVRPGWLWTIAS